MRELSPYCKARIYVQFPREERKTAEELLAQYGDEPHHREPERVRRDILELAGGDLAKLRDLLKLSADYRDLILAAEHEPDPMQAAPWNYKKKPTPWLDEP